MNLHQGVVTPGDPAWLGVSIAKNWATTREHVRGLLLGKVESKLGLQGET